MQNWLNGRTSNMHFKQKKNDNAYLCFVCFTFARFITFRAHLEFLFAYHKTLHFD